MPKNIKELRCSHNDLTLLDNLSNSVISLECHHNKLTSLDNLPESVTHLYCSNNPLTYPFEGTLRNIRLYNKFIFIFYLIKCKYKLIKYYVRFRCNKYKEELMMKIWHPTNFNRFSDWLGED